MGAMNILKVSLRHSILTLAARGWSHRRIARELAIDRGTVGKYLRLERSKPAISTLGPSEAADSKPAISTAGSEVLAEAKPAISTLGSGRPSSCVAWQEQIGAAVDGVRP